MNIRSLFRRNLWPKIKPPAAIRNRRRATEDAARIADWRRVITLTADLPPRDSRLLLLRAIAGIEAHDEAAVGSCVELCLTGRAAPAVTLGVASRLINDGRVNQAWNLLSRLDLPPERPLRLLLQRLLSRASDADLRDAVRAKLRGSGGMPHAAAPTREARRRIRSIAKRHDAAAAAPAGDEAGGGFVLTIINAGRVAARHEAEYRGRMERFDQLIAARGNRRPVVEFKDVCVNRLGQIWLRDGTIIRGKGRPLPDDWSLADIDESEEAVLASDGTRGFYHWYAERLPALAWCFATGVPDRPFLLGSHAGSFAEETLRLLGVPGARMRRIGDVFHSRRLFVSDLAVASIARWSQFRPLYERLAAAARTERPPKPHPRFLYISRRDTARRRLTNELEIEEAMRRIGVEPMLFAEMTLAAQITAIQHAALVVAPHGSGLAHIVAHPGPLQVLELHPVQNGSHSLRLTFARLSRVRGHRHTLWLEPINQLTREWTADAPGIACAVEDLLNTIARDEAGSGTVTAG